jgi:predicted nucleotidyltransferase
MTIKSKPAIRRWNKHIPGLARAIGEAAKAKRVILFGSAARGDMRDKSDLDFLVVIPNRRRRHAAWKRANDALFGLERPPVDMLVATEGDVKRLRDCIYYPIKYALDEGREMWHAV